MFRPARMEYLSVISTNDNRAKIVNSLHEHGFVEIRDCSTSFELSPGEAEERGWRAAGYLARIDKIIGYYEEEKNLLEELFHPKIPERVERSGKLFSETKKLLSEIEPDIRRIEKRLSVIDSKKKRVCNSINNLEKIKDFPVDVRDFGESRFLLVQPFLVEERYLNLLEDFEYVKKKYADRYVVIIICPAERKEELKKLALEARLERIDVNGKGKPKELLLKNKKDLAALEKEEARLKKRLKKCVSRKYRDLLIKREELEIEKERGEISRLFARTDRAFILQGWIPKKKLAEVTELLDSETNGEVAFHVSEPKDMESVPILPENPGILKPFERITEMFSPPRYDRIDPTFLIAPVFVIFYGLMLTDVAYGLALALGSLLLINGIGRVNPAMRDFSFILLLCGISTIVWGVITAGFFGDLFKYFIGAEPKQMALWIDPLTDPIAVLNLALILGIIHLNIGLLVGAYEHIREKKYTLALSEQGVWFIFQLGIGGIILDSLGIANLNLLGYSLILISIVILMRFGGLIGLMGTMGFISKVLSYVRLLALCLSTAGIAMTVNLLASLLGNIPFVGVVFMVIIFIAGHSLNFAMNGLGAFVHTLRLHFVEFFGVFYEGGGDSFSPFKARRILTK